jgi:hypothetical protein
MALDIEIHETSDKEKDGKEKVEVKKKESEEKKPSDEKPDFFSKKDVSEEQENVDHFAPHLDHPQIKSAYPGSKISGKKGC